jgi:thiamine kinase-like enzyme
MTEYLQRGEARNNEDSRAERVLDAAPAFAGKPYRYARVQSGITNVNYHVRIEGEARSYFLKLHGANTNVFIDRNAASEATRKIGEIGIGPELIWENAQIGAEIQVFLDDFRACTFADILDPQITRNILAAYRTVHTSISLSGKRTIFDMLDQHLAIIGQCGASAPRDLPLLLSHAARARSALDAAGADLSACFNDSYSSNYLVNDAGEVRMIDWEYASNADPHSDIAIFFCSLFRDGMPNSELVEAYLGRYDSQVEARILLYGPVTVLKWAMWATAQAKLSSLDFDYTKYAGFLYMRARRMFVSPHWEASFAHL